MEMEPGSALASEPDAFEDLLRGARAEAGQLRDSAVPTGPLQFVQSGDAEFFVHGPHFAGPHAGDLEQLQEPFRNRSLQLLVVREPAGADQLFDLPADAFADPFDLAEPVFLDQAVQRLAQPLQRPGRVGVGAGFEGVFAFQFQKDPDLVEDRGDPLFVHARSMRPRRAPASPGPSRLRRTESPAHSRAAR